MRVLLIAQMDNGQQNQLLAEAMRIYLNWDAKSFVMYRSYLGFKSDWTHTNNLDEAAEFAKDADLFIFQDMLSNVPGMDLVKLCGTKNTIINGTGTLMRNNVDLLWSMQMIGWPVVAPISDETIAGKLAAAPFENVIVPGEEIKAATKEIQRNDVITVCHAPTKLGLKGTDLVESILRPLEEEGVIKYLRIQNMPWIEALKAKATAHITIDSLGKELSGEPKFPAAYGAGNALEGLVLGHTVIGRISPWCYALHPDLPMVSTWGRENETRKLVRDEINAMREWGAGTNGDDIRLYRLEWVEKNFSARKQIRKWEQYIKWVMNR